MRTTGDTRKRLLEERPAIEPLTAGNEFACVPVQTEARQQDSVVSLCWVGPGRAPSWTKNPKSVQRPRSSYCDTKLLQNLSCLKLREGKDATPPTAYDTLYTLGWNECAYPGLPAGYTRTLFLFLN